MQAAPDLRREMDSQGTVILIPPRLERGSGIEPQAREDEIAAVEAIEPQIERTPRDLNGLGLPAPQAFPVVAEVLKLSSAYLVSHGHG